MIWTRVSMRALMTAVVIVAVDLAVLRFAFMTGVASLLVFPLIGTFVMSHILLIGLFRLLTRRGRPRASLAGFVIAGLIATTAVYASCLRQDGESLEEPLLRITQAADHIPGLRTIKAYSHRNPAAMAMFLPFVLVPYNVYLSAPVLAAAEVGAGSAARFARILLSVSGPEATPVEQPDRAVQDDRAR